MIKMIVKKLKNEVSIMKNYILIITCHLHEYTITKMQNYINILVIKKFLNIAQ
jgi:hypothetical protein